MLYSHRRHGPPFSDGRIELDRVLAPSWLLRRAELLRVIQDERLTRSVVGRASGKTRASIALPVAGSAVFFLEDGRELPVSEGEVVVIPPEPQPLIRVTDATIFEIDWDPLGALGDPKLKGVERRALRRETLGAAKELVRLLRDARPESRSTLTDAVRSLFEQLATVGLSFDVDAAARDLATVAMPDEQRLCDAIDRVLSHLEEGPAAVSLEDALGCSRRTLLRRTQALCKRYLLPGLAADDWRTVRDSYRILVGAVFATHADMTTRTLAAMLGYASTETLCHAFANAGLPSPSALREEWGASRQVGGPQGQS